MSAGITFSDGDGTATLSNGLPEPGDRFRGWVPIPGIIGPRREALGTGITYVYMHREDFGAKMTLAYIPNDQQGVASRLTRHLLKGGSCSVDNGAGETYPNCYIWPGSTPELSPPDQKDLRHTYTVALLNADQTEMVCIY